MIIWPPNSPDLNPMENLWTIVKRKVYPDGKQYIFSKRCIVGSHKTSSRLYPRSLIGKRTESVNERLFGIIRLNGSDVGK